jgi:phage tail-like protein
MPVQFDIQTDNYVGTHNFQVVIDEIEVLNSEFQSVSGIVSESEEVEFMHGPAPYVRRGAGRVTYEPGVMERVYKGMDEFYGWRLEVENGNIERRNVTITMMDAAFTPIRAMTLEGAWPSKWEMPDMDATSSGPAIERITLTVERVRESEPS